jgi:hypothetical protein
VVIACLVVTAGLIIAWRPGRPGGMDPGCRPSCRPRCGLGVIGVAGRPRTGWPGWLGGTCVHGRRPGGPGSVASGLAWLGSQRGPSVRSRVCHRLSRQQRRPSFPRVHAPAPPEAATAGCHDPKNSRTRSDLHFHRTGETRRSYYHPDMPLTATPAAGWYTTLCRLRSGPAAFAHQAGRTPPTLDTARRARIPSVPAFRPGGRQRTAGRAGRLPGLRCIRDTGSDLTTPEGGCQGLQAGDGPRPWPGRGRPGYGRRPWPQR